MSYSYNSQVPPTHHQSHLSRPSSSDQLNIRSYEQFSFQHFSHLDANAPSFTPQAQAAQPQPAAQAISTQSISTQQFNTNFNPNRNFLQQQSIHDEQYIPQHNARFNSTYMLQEDERISNGPSVGSVSGPSGATPGWINQQIAIPPQIVPQIPVQLTPLEQKYYGSEFSR
jgi:hypothetical protein